MKASGSIFSAVLGTLSGAPGPSLAQPPGLDSAREHVRQGTSVAPEVLRGAEEQVPVEAKPALGRSRDAGETGQSKALDASGRAREEDGGPSFGAVPG